MFTAHALLVGPQSDTKEPKNRQSNQDKQGSSENDGRSDVTDCSEFMVISNCCYNNCCRTNCSHFYLYLPEYTKNYLNVPVIS